MVLLTVTPLIHKHLIENEPSAATYTASDEAKQAITDLSIGGPISHVQLIELARRTKCSLDELVRGTKLYTAPVEKKPEKTKEYIELMARLRREQEEREYKAMTVSASVKNTPGYDKWSEPLDQTDEKLMKEINNQVSVIFNILFSVVACGVAVWMVARSWSAGVRLSMSLGSALVVAVAEVVVYMGYVRRLEEAKQEEKKKVETKTVVRTWRTDEMESEGERSVLLEEEKTEDGPARRRKVKGKD